MIRRCVELLASLKLTVALLALAMVLVFVGTLAQTKLGVWQAVALYFRSWVAFVDPGLFMGPSGVGVRLPIPGGLAIAAAMIVNLLAGHVVRFKTTRRRAGVLVLHTGLIVLLAGEFVTGFLADEGLMSIDEGASSSFVEDVREVELAVIDPGEPAHDRIVTVPGGMLARAAATGEVIDDPRLPFSVRVDAWMANAEFFHAQGPTPSTAGVGLEARAEPRPRVTGVEGGRVDTPAAYVTLFRDGAELGTWMVAASVSNAQRVDVGGGAYGISLRYRRTYLPFTLHLNDFRNDTFTGTSIAKNFSSDVRLVDPGRQTDREVRIWMNNPLRYKGLTFYQASYKPDGSGTILQVVRNPGGLMPYVASALVGGGMTWHFATMLIGFLRRRARHGPVQTGRVTASARTRPWVWAIGALGVLLACGSLLRPLPASDFDTRAFGELPVLAGGRVKPMDSAARALLMVAGGRQQVRTDDEMVQATRYLLGLITVPGEVAGLPVVRVDHPDVLALLGLGPEDSGRIPLAAVELRWQEVAGQARRAAGVEPRARDGFQRAVLRLHDRVNTLLAHAQMREPYMIPPFKQEGEWRPFYEAYLDEHTSEAPSPGVAYFASMMTAASEGDADGFNGALTSYTELLDASMPGIMRRMRLETLFNRASLFSGAAAVYVLAIVGVCVSFAACARGGSGPWGERLRASSLALLASGVLVHTVAIGLRIYLQDRPPVTNLYSSAVFVGWAATLTGAFIERLYPLGVAVLGAAAIGVGTLIVAHNLGNDGDTMETMQAVLDSNFWLATHVIAITLGYSATFLAGTIAAVYLIARACTSAVTSERERAMIRMVYGVVCFAMLLSFVGTVLGGIWADQSWGRFWGWDPKENGAALVVLINAVILHARWGGMVRARGVAALAVAGSIVTAWSWFGTNMLGVGLHAYGFMDSASLGLGIFVMSQALIMAAAALPSRIREGE